MTEIKLISGDTVYTDITEAEVRGYLQAGIKTKSFVGYLDELKTKKIMISAYAVQYVVVK